MNIFRVSIYIFFLIGLVTNFLPSCAQSGDDEACLDFCKDPVRGYSDGRSAVQVDGSLKCNEDETLEDICCCKK